MTTHWIISDLLGHRIDAEFYRPDMVENERRIHSSLPCKRLADICDRQRPITNGIRGPKLAETDFRMLRLQDVDGLWLNSQNALRITQEQYDQNRRAHCVRGDILVAIGGYIGIAGKVVDLSSQTMGQHSALLAISPESADNDFILAFLVSLSGTKLLQRYVSGGVQAGINLEDIREIRVPVPSETVQKAIGNKVRKAERLRELAEAALAEANERMSAVVPPYPSTPEQVAWTDTSYLTDRLDPQPYRSHTLALLKAIRQIRHTVLDDVCTVTGGCAVPSEEFSGDGIRLVRIRDIGVGEFEKPDVFVSESFCKDNKRYMAKEAMIVVGMDGSFRVQFFLPFDLPAMINQRVAMLNAHSMRPELVSEWLNRPEGQIQMLRRSVKTTVEHISLVDVRSVMLPRLDEDEENLLADKIRTARLCQSESVQLIELAKADVEALISNTLDLDALQAESAAIETWLAANPSPAAKTN